MVDADQILTSAIAGMVGGAVVAFWNWLGDRRNREPVLRLLRTRQTLQLPIPCDWMITVLHPIRAIDRCGVFYDDKPLPFWDKTAEPTYEEFIERTGGANVLVPRGEERDIADVVVKNGKKTIYKRKYGEIPIAKS